MRLGDLIGYLACLLVIFIIGAAFCTGWVLLMLHIDNTVPDPKHAALTAGLSMGFIVPVGCSIGVIVGAWFLKDSL